MMLSMWLLAGSIARAARRDEGSAGTLPVGGATDGDRGAGTPLLAILLLLVRRRH